MVWRGRPTSGRGQLCHECQRHAAAVLGQYHQSLTSELTAQLQMRVTTHCHVGSAMHAGCTDCHNEMSKAMQHTHAAAATAAALTK